MNVIRAIAIVAALGVAFVGTAGDAGGVAELSTSTRTYGLPRQSRTEWERVIRVRRNQRYVEIGPFRGTLDDGTEVWIGVPRGYAAALPVEDLLEVLPADWPEQFIRVRAGFDGYLLVHLDTAEMRLTIRRLAVQPLPRERRPKINILSKEDVDYGC